MTPEIRHGSLARRLRNSPVPLQVRAELPRRRLPTCATELGRLRRSRYEAVPAHNVRQDELQKDHESGRCLFIKGVPLPSPISDQFADLAPSVD